MAFLSHQDIQLLLEAISLLHSDVGTDTLPQRSLGAVEKIIGAEIVAFDGFNSNNKYTFTDWTNRAELYTQERLDIFKEYVHQHPLVPIVIGNKIQSAVKMTDYITQSDFEDLELYNEYFRLIEVSYQMGLALPINSDFTYSCSVNRLKNNFSERDRLLLTLIAPHLTQCIQNALTFERLNSALELKATGIITLDRKGKTAYISDFAEQMLKKYFADEKVSDQFLPESLLNWAKSDIQSNTDTKEYALPFTPFKTINHDGILQVRTIYNPVTQENILVMEEKLFKPAKMLTSPNLTKRETEILFWMAKGKIDSEIAQILGKSLRTINKHTEHIYQKLGVETRAAATLRALEILEAV